MNTRVYKHYDQAGLDAEYNLRARHADHQTYFDRNVAESERVRKALDCRLDVAYGDSPLEKLDVFPARKPGSPVLMFIHGGYWQFQDKSSFSYPAEPVVQAGGAFVSINYDLAPAVTLDQIVTQCRRAMAWCQDNAASFNGDPQALYVSGHSAGGHLTLMVMLPWRDLPEGQTQPTVQGACAISGLYDLEPIRLSYLNAALKLDVDSARRNSPLYGLGRQCPPLIAAVGGAETDEFRRQTGMLATALRARGQRCDELVLPNLNHYGIVGELAEAEKPLTKAMLTLMGL